MEFPKLGNLVPPPSHGKTILFNSLGELLDIGRKYFSSTGDAKYFFRGECAFFPYPFPGIFRGNFLKNEKEIFQYVLNHCPNLFSHAKTTFDKLCEMAHYGFPARILDVSSDLMMSWFMAVDGIDQDGFLDVVFKTRNLFFVPNILVFRVPENREKFIDSDLVSTLSVVARMKNEFNLGELRHEVSQERFDFDEKWFDKNYDCEKNWLVYPRLENPRVKRQKGAFILHGILPENCWRLKMGQKMDKSLKKSTTGFAFPKIPWAYETYSCQEIIRYARLVPSANYLKNLSVAVSHGATSYSDIVRIRGALSDFKQKVFEELSFVGGGQIDAYEDDFALQAKVCKNKFSK